MPLQKIPKEDIMAAIAKLGPSQPIDIRKELHEGDTFLIGAMLSELVGEGKLLITKVRRGGSPFYYDPLVPASLDKASQWLNEKDRRTYALLREQKVLREDAQQPLVRVGLQNMPDFSKRIEIDGIVHWKHYMVSDDEAVRIARGAGPGIQEMPAAEMPEQMIDDSAQHTVETPAPAVAEVKATAPVQETLPVGDAEPRPKKARAQRKKTEKRDVAQTVISPDGAADVPARTAESPDAPKRKGKRKAAEPVMMPDGAVMISPQEWLAHDTLYERVQRFAGDAKLRDARVHKPHSELTCIMTIATQFGNIEAFVHAFNRKFTPDDIKVSMPRARELGLPIIVLSTDAVPSKVTSAFKGMPNIIFRTFEKS